MAIELHGPYLGWAKKYIYLNSWRIEGDYDDCLQEAQMKFVQCQNKYGEIDPPHLMSLFQRSVIRHFDTLSTKRSRHLTVRKESVLKHGQYIREGIRGTCDAPLELLMLQKKIWSFITQLEFLAMTIKQELCEATGYSGDNTSELFKRASDDKILTDKAFEALSETAKDWLDKAVRAHNDDKPLPSLAIVNEKNKAVRTKSNGTGGNKTGRKGKFQESHIIRLTIRGNPKRRNTISFKMFELYKDGMTVKEYLTAGGRRRDLNWDTDQKFIEVSE